MPCDVQAGGPARLLRTANGSPVQAMDKSQPALAQRYFQLDQGLPNPKCLFKTTQGKRWYTDPVKRQKRLSQDSQTVLSLLVLSFRLHGHGRQRRSGE